MAQRRIRAAFIRGGTSKGVFFRAGDLPDNAKLRDAILLRALGSPDSYGRQLDGLGGGISSLSKAVIVGPSDRPGADVDFTFAQVAVDAPFVDYAGTCGNLSSAVGPFAVDEGIVPAHGGETVVRVFNTNTSKIFHARFYVQDAEAVVVGEQMIPGVSQPGAPVALEFLEPGGSMTGGLLPTGRPTDILELTNGRAIRASLVDAANPIVFVAASDAGVSANELPDLLDADASFMSLMEDIRQTAGIAMGLGASRGAVPLAVPKIAVVAPPLAFEDLQGAKVAADGFDISARALSMGRVHRALPLTLSMCLATACRINGTIPAQVMRARQRGDVRVGNPSGIITVGADVTQTSCGGWHARLCRVIRTQRRLMEGSILVPVPEMA